MIGRAAPFIGSGPKTKSANWWNAPWNGAVEPDREVPHVLGPSGEGDGDPAPELDEDRERAAHAEKAEIHVVLRLGGVQPVPRHTHGPDQDIAVAVAAPRRPRLVEPDAHPRKPA